MDMVGVTAESPLANTPSYRGPLSSSRLRTLAPSSLLLMIIVSVIVPKFPNALVIYSNSPILFHRLCRLPRMSRRLRAARVLTPALCLPLEILCTTVSG